MILLTVSYLEFNIPFQHKYGYIRDEMLLTVQEGNITKLNSTYLL